MTDITVPAISEFAPGQYGIVVEAMDVGWDRPWVLDALKPCESEAVTCHCGCDGPCPDCHNGKRVVEFQVPCVQPLRTMGGAYHPGDCCDGSGFISAGRWTVNKAIPIVGGDLRGLPRPHVHAVRESVWRTYLYATKGSDDRYLDLPGDPADMPGNYFVIVKRVTEDEEPEQGDPPFDPEDQETWPMPYEPDDSWCNGWMDGFGLALAMARRFFEGDGRWEDA